MVMFLFGEMVWNASVDNRGNIVNYFTYINFLIIEILKQHVYSRASISGAG